MRMASVVPSRGGEDEEEKVEQLLSDQSSLCSGKPSPISSVLSILPFRRRGQKMFGVGNFIYFWAVSRSWSVFLSPTGERQA